MQNQLSVCSILAASFHYEWNCRIYVNDLGDHNSVYVFSAEMFGFCTKHVWDHRSKDPAFTKIWTLPVQEGLGISGHILGF